MCVYTAQSCYLESSSHKSFEFLGFSCSSTAAFQLSSGLCSAQLLKLRSAKYTSCFALAGSQPRFKKIVVLAVADGLFSLYGSQHAGKLLIPPPPPPRPPISLVVSVDVKHHVYILERLTFSVLL